MPDKSPVVNVRPVRDYRSEVISYDVGFDFAEDLSDIVSMYQIWFSEINVLNVYLLFDIAESYASDQYSKVLFFQDIIPNISSKIGNRMDGSAVRISEYEARLVLDSLQFMIFGIGNKEDLSNNIKKYKDLVCAALYEQDEKYKAKSIELRHGLFERNEL